MEKIDKMCVFFLGGGGGVQDNSFTGGNYAFSPYGLASVLVLLYEGSCGESAVQIQRTLSFPWNKFIVRLGFRDIHDRLKVLIIKIQFNFFWRQKFIDLSIDFFFVTELFQSRWFFNRHDIK